MVSKQEAFLAAYAEVGNITHAAEIVGVERTRHYDWLRSDPEYAEAFKKADEQAIEKLEQEARRRAVTGVRRKKFTGKGEPVIDPVTGEQYVEEEYSDTLLIFLMKGARPEKYKDRVHNEHTGADGGPIQIVSAIPRPALGDDD
jgi:hypothetical protein